MIDNINIVSSSYYGEEAYLNSIDTRNNNIVIYTDATKKLYLNENCSGMFGSKRNFNCNISNLRFNYKYVKDMSNMFLMGSNLTSSYIPYAPNAVDMSSAFGYCSNLKGSPKCGDNVTNMFATYDGCYNITGSPACGPNVINMSCTYSGCSNLTGPAVCGNNVTNMASTYYTCTNLIGNPVCGDNVTDMLFTYFECHNLNGAPVCGNNVNLLHATYYNCYNLKGNPVCGDNVTDMFGAYCNCYNLTGAPVCGNKVIYMSDTYYNCINLQGTPICGENVINMANAYWNCRSLTGSPVFGDNVINTYQTYWNCRGLTGEPTFSNATSKYFKTYLYCSNITGNLYLNNYFTNLYGAFRYCYNLGPTLTWDVSNLDKGGGEYTFAGAVNITDIEILGYPSKIVLGDIVNSFNFCFTTYIDEDYCDEAPSKSRNIYIDNFQFASLLTSSNEVMGRTFGPWLTDWEPEYNRGEGWSVTINGNTYSELPVRYYNVNPYSNNSDVMCYIYVGQNMNLE